MVLRVEFAEFPATVRRLLGDAEVFVCGSGSGVLLTAAEPLKGFVIESFASKSMDEAKAMLSAAEFAFHQGSWSLTGSGASPAESELTVTAIAYTTTEDMPGLWVDAFDGTTSPALALRACYDEFSSNGEIGEMSFEEFVRVAKPNVVIASPDELREFARRKAPCD